MGRRVTVNTIAVVNGQIRPFSLYTFILTRNTYTATESVLIKPISVRADKNGRVQIQLWDNSQGVIPSAYLVTEPDGTKYEILINSSTPDIVELSALRTLAVPQQSPNYNTLLDIVQNLQLSFPSGGIVGNALIIKSLNPRVIQWGEPDIDVGDLAQNFTSLLD